jgi:putative salt-induced outer membrane protein YdiY
MSGTTAISVLLIGCLLGGAACAGEVVFANGDRLSGRIEQVADGKLIFESEVAGKLTIDISKVQTLSSDEPLEIHFKDGTVVKQKVIKSQTGKIAIETGPTLKAQEFELSSVASVNPPPPPEPEWHGSITAGLSSTHGNTSTDNRNLSFDLNRRGKDDRVTLKGDYARSRQKDPDTGDKKTTEDWWRTRAKYDYFLSEKAYVYGSGRYENDSIADLDRRVVVGGGGGYQWVESPEMNFSTELGVASLYEKFDNATESNSEVSVEAGYHFDKKLTESLKFINDLTYYPSLEQVSDYYLTTTAQLRASITERMFTDFKVIFDYDATPAVDAGNSDVKYIFGLGWSF